MNSIHDYDRRYASAVRKVEKSTTISQKNRELILRHKDWLLSAQNLSKGRVVKCLYYLLKMADWLGKDFDQVTKDDLEGLVGRINGSDYVPFSKKEHKSTLKRFYKWLRNTEDYPPEVKWIKPESKGMERIKLPEEILTEHEIKGMIDTTPNIRDKAFIATIFNSGCRIGELLFVRIKHIVFQENNTARMFVDGKTGKRWVLLISCVPYLKDWLNSHPAKDNPEAFVWAKDDNSLMTYGMARYRLDNAAERAGIAKKVNPHAFRHASATFYANHLTEAQMKQYFGWQQASRMASIYIHISGRDVDNAMLKAHGMPVNGNGNEVSELRPRICPRCGLNNLYCRATAREDYNALPCCF